MLEVSTAMTKIELNRFQQFLNKKLADLENGNRNRGAIAIETSPDELDRIQHGQERDLAMGALDRDSKLLREVRSALSRIQAGTYGICSDCRRTSVHDGSPRFRGRLPVSFASRPRTACQNSTGMRVKSCLSSQTEATQYAGKNTAGG